MLGITLSDGEWRLVGTLLGGLALVPELIVLLQGIRNKRKLAKQSKLILKFKDGSGSTIDVQNMHADTAEKLLVALRSQDLTSIRIDADSVRIKIDSSSDEEHARLEQSKGDK